MINTDKDPLRFLKQRKKSFHHTPQKDNNFIQTQIIDKYQNSNHQKSNSNSRSNKQSNKPNKNQNNRQNYLKDNRKEKSKDRLKDNIKDNIQNNRNSMQSLVLIQKDKKYDPLKYFSNEVQQYLNNKKKNGFAKTSQKVSAKRMNQHIRQQQQFLSENQGKQAIYINQQTFNPKRSQGAQLTNQMPQIIQQYTELKQCSSCGRNFNPNSYLRHIKICQKVFTKKRKQFSSKKQRISSAKHAE